MSNNNKEKIYFAAATNIITMIAVIFLPLLFGECELTYWYFRKLSFIKDNLFSNGILTMLSISLAFITILFVRGIRKEEFISSSIPVTNETNSKKIVERQRFIMKEQEKLNEKKWQAVRTYIIDTLAPYVEEQELLTLIVNAQRWVKEKSFVPEPITTNGKITTLDLRHLSWNIGKRLEWNGNQCATFIKICFPMELKDLEIETIRRNLRQKGSCVIELDVPEKGSYEFHHLPSEQK